MLSIRTDLSSLIVQNSMGSATNKLNQAIERMTTGAKLNHAKDNAANYSIATDMLTKISAYDVAADNTAMGMDLVTTMSDTLELLNDHASRIRDLCEQASNGTYGEESLKAIQSEIDARLEEIERIKANAEYNGIKLFEGGGAGGIETSVPFLKPITRLTEDEAIAQGYTVVKNADELVTALNNNESVCLMNDIDMTSYSLISNSVVISSCSNVVLEGNGFSIKNINCSAGSSGVYFIKDFSNATLRNLNIDFADITGAYGVTIVDNISGTAIIENCSVTGNIYAKYGFCFAYQECTIKNCYINPTSLYKESNPSNIFPTSGVVENSFFNNDIINATSSLGSVSAAELDAILAAAKASMPSGGTKNISLQVGINSDANSQIKMSLESLKGLGAIDATSSDSARSALSTLDEYINSIGNLQTNLGSVSNRLESVLDEILIQHDNLVSSRSTIRDADIAEVSSQYIQQQILQQASATLLSTSKNIQYQNVLGLLQSLR